MIIKKFNELNENELNYIINKHFNHWVQFNPLMIKENTEYKFKNIYTQNTLPFGIAIKENNQLIGFCVFKIENLKKYPEYYPWFSDVMIFEEFRNKGYGRKLLDLGTEIIKNLGYKKIFVWTDQAPEFYKKLGFKYLKQIEKNEGGFGELFYKDI